MNRKNQSNPNRGVFIGILQSSRSTERAVRSSYTKKTEKIMKEQLIFSHIYKENGTIFQESMPLPYSKPFQALGELHTGMILQFSALQKSHFLISPSQVSILQTLPHNISETPALLSALSPTEVLPIHYPYPLSPETVVKQQKEEAKQSLERNRLKNSAKKTYQIFSKHLRDMQHQYKDTPEETLFTIVHNRLKVHLDNNEFLFELKPLELCQEEAEQCRTQQNPNSIFLLRRMRNIIASLGNYPEEMQYFTEVYLESLLSVASTSLHLFQKSYPDKNPKEIMNMGFFSGKAYLELDLVGLFKKHSMPMEIKKILSELIPPSPKEEYPQARAMERNFIIHVGGTNTGKTYEALQRLKEAESGVYLSPLRLLALEVQENMLESGIPCSMLTGEEEDIQEHSRHISSTIEKLNISAVYEVAVLDECQMIADKERGFAWTRAVLGCQASEIHCCVAPEALDILVNVIKHCEDPYTIVEHQRKTPLTYKNEIVPLDKAKKGDVFVTFSRKMVLLIAHELKSLNISVSVIYGALPYRTRRLQMEQFLSGKSTVLVATDAIGMGLNLPIKRVIFTADEKYDGEAVRPLAMGEIKQIAGRAGRFGIYNEGFVCRAKGNLNIETALKSTTPNLKTAYLGFSEHILNLDYDIEDILKVWWSMPNTRLFKKMDIKRYLTIIALIRQEKIELSKVDLLRAANIPFNEENKDMLKLFISYLKHYVNGQAVFLPESPPLSLESLELYYRQLDLYYSFSKNFQLDYDKESLLLEKEEISELINRELVNMKKMKRKPCRICGVTLSALNPSSICDECYNSNLNRR